MQVFSTLQKLGRDSAVAIGNFDGFHIGHRRIVAELAASARRHNLFSILLTFFPHPRIFFHQDVQLIHTDAQRRDILAQQPVDSLFFVPFADVVERRAGAFLEEVLLSRLRMKALVVSDDFRFGRGREGNLEYLLRKAQEMEFALYPVAAVEVAGVRVSSSLIRKRLARGEIEEANRMLGSWYFIDGLVQPGVGRGRLLGFPTLNIQTDNPLLPEGVFHTRVAVAGRQIRSLTNIGHTPTFSGEGPLPKKVECHLLDFQGALYGERVRVFFLRKLRDEIRFDSPEALQNQIRRDIEAVNRFDKESLI